MNHAYRIALVTLAVGSFAFILTGCGNSGGEGKRPDPATQVKGQKPSFAAPGAPPAPNAPAATTGAKAE